MDDIDYDRFSETDRELYGDEYDDAGPDTGDNDEPENVDEGEIGGEG